MSHLEFCSEVGKLAPDLLSLTYRFTRDRDEAKDLVQDTLLRALRYRSLYRRDTNLKGWLFTIMRNIHFNHFRKTGREQANLDRKSDLRFLRVADNYTYHHPDGCSAMEEIWEHIRGIRKELRDPFTMHLSGYLYEEISKMLKIPVGTVKSRIFLARQEIKKRLPGYR